MSAVIVIALIVFAVLMLMPETSEACRRICHIRGGG